MLRSRFFSAAAAAAASASVAVGVGIAGSVPVSLSVVKPVAVSLKRATGYKTSSPKQKRHKLRQLATCGKRGGATILYNGPLIAHNAKERQTKDVGLDWEIMRMAKGDGQL